MIGLGITTYNRFSYFNQSISSVIEHLRSKVDLLLVYNDHSETSYQYPKETDIIFQGKENKGVAHAKNTLLKTMMAFGCNHLFLMEDDIIVKSSEVLDRYITVAQQNDLHHLNFAHHGPANAGGYKQREGEIELYPHCVGAFSYYSREAIEQVGFMDEKLKNAWEHVFHTKAIAEAGLTSPFWYFADISGSRELLEEIPGSIENSSIRQDEAWRKHMDEGYKYACEKYGSLPPQI